jgi:hypothetical protein
VSQFNFLKTSYICDVLALKILLKDLSELYANKCASTVKAQKKTFPFELKELNQFG